MTTLLLKHLATSLTRQLPMVGYLNHDFVSAAVGAYRCLCTLTTGRSTLLLSSTRVFQPTSSCSSALFRPSLLGECRHLPCIYQSAGMKTKSALKRRCKDCFFVRRRGRLFVYCKTNPRHKQRQG